MIYVTFSVDVSEAHYAQIIALLLTFFLGEEVWYHQVSLSLALSLSLSLSHFCSYSLL